MIDINIRKLVEEFVRTHSKTEVEEWIVKQFEEKIPCVGSGFARNIESTGMIYYTVLRGIYQGKVLPYMKKEGRLVDYVIKTNKPFIFNSIANLPPGVELKGKQTDDDKYLLIPIGPKSDLIGRPPKVHGIVVLARRKTTFTQEDLEKALAILPTMGLALDSYLNAIHLKKILRATEAGKCLILQSAEGSLSLRDITHKYLEIAIDLIDAAEKGSALIETPLGMKFIAAIGYDEDVLLNLPPLDTNITKIEWYGQGEDKLMKGIPRIITDQELETFRDKDPINNVLPEALQLRSNLMIPVIVKGHMFLDLNLDSFSTSTAFDDMDIEIAKHLATYMTASYELIMRKQNEERHTTMIKQLTSLVENFTVPVYRQKTEREIKEAFINLIIEGTQILNPYAIYSTASNLAYRIRLIHGTDNDKLRKLFQKSVEELMHLDKDRTIRVVDNYSLFTFKGKEWHGEGKITYYIGFVKHKDIWTEADIHHIINIVNVSILMARNLAYMHDIALTQEDTLSLLGKALEFRDLETKGHTERTAYMTSIMADAINFPDKKGIMWGAYVHDIGKIAIPDYILLKPGRLTKEEFEIMKKHVIYGYRLLSGIRRIPKTTLNVVKYHHEKWDGTGYPEGLRSEEIPLEARIFAIIDVFDALISKRPYKEAWPIEKAIAVIKEGRGKHFDPYIVDVFLDLLDSTDLIEKLRDITKQATETE